MFPSIAKYSQIIQTEGGKAFRTLSNLTFIPSRTTPVRIYSYGSGSYAVVFKAKGYSKTFAIRCFISAEQENIGRYKKLASYLNKLDASWITKIELLEDEVYVDNRYYPVIKMDWIEGQLLNNFITQVIDNNTALTELQNEVVSVSKSLENLKIGHGDIQCGNIIVAKNADGKNIIKLIDYDGMYIPSFANKINLERGRSEFQHPNRSQLMYNERIDRFSFWVILCAIEALKFDKTLWFEIMRGGFNTLDNLLFVGDDFKYFNNSKLVNRLYAFNKPSLSFYLNKLNKFCNSLPDTVEPPTIFDSSEQAIENVIPPTFPSDRFGKQIEILTDPGGAAVITSTFQRIGTTPLKIDKEKYLGQTLVISYGTQFKQVQIEQNTGNIVLFFNQSEIDLFTSTKQIPQADTDLNYDSIPHSRPNKKSVQTKTYNLEWLGIVIAVALIAVAILINLRSNGADESSHSPSVDNTNTLSSNSATSYVDTVVAVVDALPKPPPNKSVNNTSINIKNDNPTLQSNIDENIFWETTILGTYTDSRDGQSYKVKRFGNQIWMVENYRLNTSGSKKYDGTVKMGNLYKWKDISSNIPSGWKLPSNDDFHKLLTFMGARRTKGEGYTIHNFDDFNLETGKNSSSADFYSTGSIDNPTDFEPIADFWSSSHTSFEKNVKYHFVFNPSISSVSYTGDISSQFFSVRLVKK